MLSVHADINDSARIDAENDAEDDPDDEDLFELASIKNQDVDSSVEVEDEAEGVDESEVQSDGDDPVSEQLSQQRTIVEDIRFTNFKCHRMLI